MTEQVFTLTPDGARLHQPAPARLEKDIQNLIERNLDVMLDLTFLASEFTTPCQTMRMDTLCLDKNLCPVVVEYKLDSDDSVLNQGLFYLNWVLNNRSTFQLLVQNILGREYAERIDWSGARVVIVAGAFAKYDLQAVEQIQNNLDLYTYKIYEPGIMVLKHVAGQRRQDYRATSAIRPVKPKMRFADTLDHSPQVVQDRIQRFTDALHSLSDDLVTSDEGEFRIISAPAATIEKLARLYLTEHAYPKLRLEIFGAKEDFELSADLRTKKTRNGFEFSVTDDEYFDYAVEAVRQAYSKACLSW
jgi:hypothetical protein